MGAVDLSVTVDLESGYGKTPASVGCTVERSVQAGAVGCNLENNFPENGRLRPVAEQAERIAAARKAADTPNRSYFINARTDGFFQAPPEEHGGAMLEAALERARAYAGAGADGLFVPGLTDEALIARLAAASPLPLNVMVEDKPPRKVSWPGWGWPGSATAPGPTWRRCGRSSRRRATRPGQNEAWTDAAPHGRHGSRVEMLFSWAHHVGQCDNHTRGKVMRRIIVLERITVDGIFDAAGMAEWDFPYDSEGRVAVIAGGIQASDAYLLGRTTYEMLAPGWSALKNNEYGVADKLNSMAKYVVSSSPLEFEWGNTTVLRGDAVEEVGKLKRQPGGDILVHGSAKLVESLLAAGLVDELQLLVHPVVMGGGARLFNDTEHTAKLELVEARPVGLGVVLLRYHPAKG